MKNWDLLNSGFKNDILKRITLLTVTNMKDGNTRRDFLKSAALIGGFSLFPGPISVQGKNFSKTAIQISEEKSIIGGYGSWAANLAPSPPALSYRNDGWSNINSWREEAMAKTNELLASPVTDQMPPVSYDKKYEYDGLEIEELSWQLPYGNRTEAVLLQPKGKKEKLPAILALHDHGGNKYFGKEKIIKTADNQHPMIAEHQKTYYGGFAWANRLAKRGYVVLVPDSFAFGSRRVLFADMEEVPYGDFSTKGKTDPGPEDTENINVYNSWASAHEHILSKSLFCAGTTWPGVFLAEDKVALDVLSAQPHVDSNRLGCGGLSGGGLRTVYLGGLDHRIKCAAAAGFMTTWRDFMLHKAYTHTWMTYTPLLPNYLDFPEILALRAPLPAMTLNNIHDRLFTLEEMESANEIIEEVYAKAGAPDHYQGKFYEGDHKFDAQMQADAFNWFDTRL